MDKVLITGGDGNLACELKRTANEKKCNCSKQIWDGYHQ